MAELAAVFAPPNPAFHFDWKTVEQGVPISALEAFSTYSGFAVKDLLEVVIPARTLKHRRQRREPLNEIETERLRRVARIYDLTVKVYGDPERAREWLLRPKGRFEERTPMTLLRNQAGEEAVEEFLIQIDEGMFA